MQPLYRLYWIADTLRDQRWLLNQTNPGPRDLVLDVGSGAGPALRANVCVDKFPFDSTERHGAPVRRDRPLVVGDIHALPFVDNAFDFVICSHVLEHVEDPTRAVAELQRIAPRGYIETPSAAWERIAGGFAFHRWMVSIDNGSLVFEAKTAPLEDPELTKWFSSFLDSLHLRKLVWFMRRAAGVYTSLCWESEIPLEVRGTAAEGSNFVSARYDDLEGVICEQARGEGTVARMLDAYGRFLRRSSDRPWLEIADLLCCPACRGVLERGPGSFLCRSCNAAYRVDSSGCPHMLADHFSRA